PAGHSSSSVAGHGMRLARARPCTHTAEPMRASAVLAALALAASYVPAAVGAGRIPAFSGCMGTAQAVRPHDILLACGDGNFYGDHLHWSNWTAQSASATGVAHQNDCQPYCAAGHFHAYPGVSIRLRRPETCTRGRRLFTRVTYRFAGRKPPGEKNRQ